MCKKYLAVLLALSLCMAAGCGRAGSAKTTDESAVDFSTADSDTESEGIQNAELPPITEEEEKPITYEGKNLYFSVPKGFKEESSGYFVPRSSKDEANVYYVVSKSDIDISEMEEKEYEEALEADYYDTYGDKVDVVIEEYAPIKVNGRSGLRILMDFELKGDVYEQLQYLIYNKTESHIITYTQFKDGKWTEEFKKSGESISFVN